MNARSWLSLMLGAVLAIGCQSAPTREPIPVSESSAVSPAADPSHPDGSAVSLRLRFEGWGEHRGQLVAAIYRDAASFDAGQSPVVGERLDVADEAVEWAVDLPPGTYAVKAFLDLDSNGVLDRGDFGIPSEPYGFSNNARGRFGPPSWSEARFRLTTAASRVIVVR